MNALGRDITENCVKKFIELMSTVNWNLITQTLNPNYLYNILIDKVLKIYNEAFPLRKFTMETKNLCSPWITTRIKK